MENNLNKILILADQYVCDHCGVCVAVCPENCIDLEAHRIDIDDNLCTRCGFCVVVCPVEALKKEENVLLAK
jgi:ferredoxin